MISNKSIANFERICNALELLGVVAMLIMAFGFQFVLIELPCPLCLLQRIGFIGIAFGFLLNLRFGLRPSHYAITLISALFTSFVALRQIALHIVPGTGSYGTTLLGMHLYTWSFIICMLIVFATTVMLGVDRQYLTSCSRVARKPILTHGLFLLMVLLIGVNLVFVYLQCGLKDCPDDPVQYHGLKVR